MKKTKLLALLCAAAMLVSPLQGTVVMAAEDATWEVVNNEEKGELAVDQDYIPANSLQEGALYSAPIYTYDEQLPVIQAGESWRAELKARLVTALQNYSTLVSVDGLGIPYDSNTRAAINEVFREVLDENPGFFYAYYIGDIYYWIPSYVTDEFEIVYYPSFTDSAGNVDPAKVSIYNSALAKALSHVKSGMSNVEKLLALYDYLVLNCEYDYENYLNGTLEKVDFTAYGALVNRSAVCNGYALAYADLVKHLGIKNYVVASDSHAWNLVYVDGNWYHIDTTWADPVFDTRDDYDMEGFVNHEYFLVSDAELRALDTEDHGSWEVQNSTTTVPTASKSGSYAGYIFRDSALYTPATYYNGEWYYVTDGAAGRESNYITKSKIDGSNATVLDSLGHADFAQVEGDYLYYDRYEDLYTDGIYAVNLNGSLNPERVMTMVGSKGYRDFDVYEFAVHDNILGMILANKNNTDSWVRLEYVTSHRETTPMPTLQITSTQLNYPNGIETLDKAALPVNLVYSDGTQIAVTYSPYDVKLTNSADGIYTVSVEWRGLTAQKQVSVNGEWPIEDMLSTTSNWMYKAAKYAYDNGYMNGTAATTFEPNKMMERSMVAQILYNMEKKPDVAFKDLFADVPESGWFAKAVTWAYDNKIVSGYDEDTFGTYDNVTRQQLAIMLRKYAESLGIDTSERADISGYADVDSISPYALESIKWAIAEGVMVGKGENIDPLGYATRAEGAAMIKNFCEKVKN